MQIVCLTLNLQIFMSESVAKDNAGQYACLLFDSTLKTVLGTAENEKLFGRLPPSQGSTNERL